jgi:hypothetical protein
MTDEHVLGRRGPGHSKQRTSPEPTEVEGRPIWIADDLTGQEIVESAALFEVAYKGEKIAQKPGARARHRRQDGEAIGFEHGKRYAGGVHYLPVA